MRFACIAGVFWLLVGELVPATLAIRTEQCSPPGCEPIYYDSDHEFCCGDKVYRKEADENGNLFTECCQNNETVFSTSTHECCRGGVTLVNSSTHGCCGRDGTYDLASQDCCGETIYDKEEKTCCGGALYRHIDGFTCCGDEYHQSGNTLCCTQEEESHVISPARDRECCGLDAYRPDDQMCCGGRIYDRLKVTTRCCGSTVFDDSNELCCSNTVFPRGVNDSCCHGTPYDPHNQACCHGIVHQRGGNASCCRGEPYNVENSTCVDDAQLDPHGVPYIEGITETVSQDGTAYLSTESFLCGDELYAYDSGFNACCGDAISFNSKMQLCCYGSSEGARVLDKTSPDDTECCGSGTFDPDAGGCCDGYQWYDLLTQQCCENGSSIDVRENCHGIHQCFLPTTAVRPDKTCIVHGVLFRYNNETSVCTPAGPEDIPGAGPSDGPDDSTCAVNLTRNIPYNSDTSVCTPSGIKAIPPGIGVCGNTGELYSVDEHICCNGSKWTKMVAGRERHCCDGSVVFFPDLQTCSGGRILRFPTRHAQNCGELIYDSRYYGCDTNGDIRRKEEIEAFPDRCSDGDTAVVYYNELDHSCCEGYLITANHTCCTEHSSDCCLPGAREGYDTNINMCCGGVLHTKEPGFTCCGTEKYPESQDTLCCMDQHYENPAGELVCDDRRRTVTGRLSRTEITCRGNQYHGSVIECCGSEAYDPSREICCQGVKYPKTNDQQDCCGRISYIPGLDGALCCGESLFNNTVAGEACCGNVLYNTSHKTCCTTGGGQYVMAPGGQCCSNEEVFDESRDTCCDGLIHEGIANGQCCGNHVIRDPAHEVCRDGQYHKSPRGE